MRVKLPPKINMEALEKRAPELFAALQKASVTDNKGRYFHWNDIYHKRSQFDDAELFWMATKLVRKQISKNVTLSSNKNSRFSFCAPDGLQAQLHKIDKLAAGHIDTSDNELLNNAGQNHYLVSSLIQEETINSAQLEGATTTYTKAKALLNSDTKPKTESERMIINNYQLLRAAKDRKNSELSEELILKLHLLATEDAINNDAVPGAFREDDSIAVKDKQSHEIIHTPPLASEISERMAELYDFANKDHDGTENEFIHPVIKAIIIHFMIGFIHPFGDGNGRVARALFYWYMLKSGYWLFEYISISKLLKEAPVKYQNAYLYCETDEGDLTYFIDYQLNVCLRAIDNFFGYLKRKQQEYKAVLLALKDSSLEGALNKVELNILKDALRNPGSVFTAKTIVRKYDVVANSARKHLRTLAQYHLLLETKIGRESAFLSPADLADKLNELKQATPQ
ncbi:Fic family protein [Pontiellaceae bacterium B12219]|nr:Fic family protein [Pontiellaceae bacterium B12219]